MAKYGRRNVSEWANGIGNWNSIMRFISYSAIPINMMVLIYCRFPSVTVGMNQDLESLPFEEKSVLF